MGDVSTGCTLTRIEPTYAGNILRVETAATVDTGDTIAIDLKSYGGTTFLGILGFCHTTANSVVVTEAPTTSVTTTTLTITVGGSTASNYIRVYYVFYK